MKKRLLKKRLRAGRLDLRQVGVDVVCNVQVKIAVTVRVEKGRARAESPIRGLGDFEERTIAAIRPVENRTFGRRYYFSIRITVPCRKLVQ